MADERHTVIAAVLVGSAVIPAAAEDNEDLVQVEEDLRGTVLIMGGEVFDEDLEPVADVAEYEEAFEDAGVNIPDVQIDATLPAPGIDVAPRLPGSSGFGLGIGGPLKLEAPGCSGHDQYRKLQTMTRGGKNGVVSRGVAYRMCGVGGRPGWGWRHIASEHANDWAKAGANFDGSWSDFAVWAIYGIVGSPSSVTYQPVNNSYLYTAPVQVWKGGRLITTYMPKVSIAKGTWRILTAFPTR